MMDRATALAIVEEHVKEIGLRRHMLSVEAAMRAYAVKLNGDPEIWGLAGLFHDFDWEIHPDLKRHPADGAPILRARGCPEEVVRAILSHSAAITGVNPDSPMEFALCACDEITGLITASALVRPSKRIQDVEVSSVKKKWKDDRFAAGVHRPEVEKAVAAFSAACFSGTLDLWTHVGTILTAMQGIAGDLGLAGT
jgi:putative nucleotidyltransferase with HDIG domain